MELTQGVRLQYIVDSAEQASRLENAINSFPARINLAYTNEKLGDRPRLFVLEAQGTVVLRPRGCRIEGVQYQQGVTALSHTANSESVQCNGIKYFILDEPLYELKRD